MEARSADERWQRLSSRIAAHEHVDGLLAQMAQRSAELRRAWALARPWPSLLM